MSALARSSLVFSVIMTLFNGFYTCPSKPKSFGYQDLVTAYMNRVIYVGLCAFWKVYKIRHGSRVSSAVLTARKAVVDAADAHWQERKPRNFLERVRFSIA